MDNSSPSFAGVRRAQRNEGKRTQAEIKIKEERKGRGEIRMKMQGEKCVVTKSEFRGSVFCFLNFNITEKGLNLLRQLICKDEERGK